MELLDLYNNKKEKIGKVYDRDSGEPGRGEYKLSVHVWVVNSKDQFLIQKEARMLKILVNGRLRAEQWMLERVQ